jgi:hypothetical protein
MPRIALIVVLSVCAAAPADGPPAQAGGAQGHVLFAFDDHAIPWAENLKLTLARAEKHPANPVLRRGPEGAPDHGHAILYGSVLRVGGKFRMWYLGMFETELKDGQAPGWWRPMCYAESDDGVRWTKPELGLVRFNGGTRNNICLVESDPPSLGRVNDFLSVLYEPDDPDPSRRYKAAYIAHVPREDLPGLGKAAQGPVRVCTSLCAASPDGLRWRVVGAGPINAPDQHFEVSSLYRFGGFYYASGQTLAPWPALPEGRTAGRAMGVYRSPDFEHWSPARALGFVRPGQTLSSPVGGQQTHMGAGIWDRGNVLVGLYGMWQDGPKELPKGAPALHGMRIDLGLVVSDDGVHFREPVPDFKVVARGEEGAWDSVSLLQANAFANVGERTYLWYSHWDNEERFRHMEIGLATLRRDGFGYLSRRDAHKVGQCVTATIPAAAAGYRVSVNVEGVSRSSPLTVELLDRRSRPLAGYSGADAATVTEPGVSRPVAWPGRLAERTPAGLPFAVKLGFPDSGDVRLYAVYLEPGAVGTP